MGIVCLLVGIGLLAVAYRCRNDPEWLFPLILLICGLGNIGAFVHMASTDFKYTYKLAPNYHPAD